jgi:hypothetical protein
MDEESKQVLLRVKENDNNLTKLYIKDDVDQYYRMWGGIFNSTKASDFTKLGQYIAKNTHIKYLEINIQPLININIRKGFYDGLRRNSFICRVILKCNNRNLGVVGSEILSTYRRNSSHLIQLKILQADFQQSELEHVALTVRSCSNLKEVTLYQCNITDQKLLSIVEALRGQSSLERLYLNRNRIGNDGCQALATLLSHPNSNVQEIQLSDNNIDNEGAIAICNSLINNTKLKKIFLSDNPIDRNVKDVFYNLLCDTTSINSIFSSNHTLWGLYFSFNDGSNSVRHELSQVQTINQGKCNKRHIAMKKILKYNILNMEPLYDWDSEDEYSLKALPFVINWFERARKAVRPPRTRVERLMEFHPRKDNPGRRYNIDERKLSAIYQFARDMPLMFVDQRVLRRSKRKRVGS